MVFTAYRGESHITCLEIYLSLLDFPAFRMKVFKVFLNDTLYFVIVDFNVPLSISTYISGSQPSKCCDPLIQFLMLWWPQHKIISLLSHNHNFATVMNHNVNIQYAGLTYRLRTTLYQAVFSLSFSWLGWVRACRYYFSMNQLFVLLSFVLFLVSTTK